MIVKFFEKIICDLRAKELSDYEIARSLKMSQTNLRQYLGEIEGRKPTQKIHPKTLPALLKLCKQHKIEPKTWKALGKMIDAEYLAPSSKDKR